MNYYLKNFSVREQIIKSDPPFSLGIIIVIPCFNEPNLNASLESLDSCDLPLCSVEVIVVINSGENAAEEALEENLKSLKLAEYWRDKKSSGDIKFHFVHEDKLPQKDAGVGLARKIGMDEAVRRFENINKPEGVIVCFDADSQCESNYLVAIESHFELNPKTPACSIHFEHPIAGTDYPESIYKGIEEYELHLRYYKNGLKFCGLPYAFHTIGSSMAVRSVAYQKQNGMNKRKAGEDFYFLQKLIPLGNFTEIKTTTVIPSPRVSDRVPFGTGKAMQNYIDNNSQEHKSYSIKSFIDLKQFCAFIPDIYDNYEVEFPLSIKKYLDELNFSDNLEKIKKNSTSKDHFVKLFFNWFNAFRVLKYMHYARDNFYPDISISEASGQFLDLLEVDRADKSLIQIYRELDK